MSCQWEDNHIWAAYTYKDRVNLFKWKFQTNMQTQSQRNDNNDDVAHNVNDRQAQIQMQILVNVQNLNDSAVNALQSLNNDTLKISSNCQIFAESHCTSIIKCSTDLSVALSHLCCLKCSKNITRHFNHICNIKCNYLYNHCSHLRKLCKLIDITSVICLLHINNL